MRRFKWWVIELVSSLIVAFSFMGYNRLDILDDEWSRKDKWVFFVGIASIILSFFGTVASLFPPKELVGSICRVESILVWLTCGLWTFATITSLVGPYKDETSVIDESYIVIRPNLYFFTLSCLVTSILLVASWFQENLHTEDSLTTIQWILLGAMSFFVMINGIAFRDTAASSVFEIQESNTTSTIPLCESENYNCSRANLAIVLGGVSAGIACLVTPWRMSNMMCQTDVSAFLFVAWFISTWFLTFDSGPGNAWGNLYFGTWGALFLSLNILIISSTMDETTMKLANQKQSTTIDRDDVWDRAYDQLDTMTKWNARGVNRSDSYASLFAPDDEWPGLDASNSRHEGGDSYHACEDARIRASQVSRLEKWAILAIATAVNLASLVPTLELTEGGTIATRFAIAIPSTSLVVSYFGFATCLRTSMYAKRIQATSIVASVILWTVALPLISLYSNQSILGYGDNDVTTLTEANLFFSTWFCLFYSFLLATSWRNASVTTTDWVLMSIVSFALLGSSVAFLRKYNGESFVSGLHSCDGICGTRVTFGFYLGLSSGLISLVLILLYRLGPCFHLVFGVASICVWGVGVGYITFAPSSGHGTSAGTIHFACWSALFTSIDISTMNLLLLVNEKETKESTNPESTPSAYEGTGVDETRADPEGRGNVEETKLDPESGEIEQPSSRERYFEAPLYSQEFAAELESPVSMVPEREVSTHTPTFYASSEDLVYDNSTEMALPEKVELADT